MDIEAALLAAWASIVGVFSPLVIQIVKKAVDTANTWSTRGKQILALIIAAAGGLITTAGVEGFNFAGHTWQEFVAVATAVWGISQVAYLALWKSIFQPHDEGYTGGVRNQV